MASELVHSMLMQKIGKFHECVVVYFNAFISLPFCRRSKTEVMKRKRSENFKTPILERFREKLYKIDPIQN